MLPVTDVLTVYIYYVTCTKLIHQAYTVKGLKHKAGSNCITCGWNGEIIKIQDTHLNPHWLRSLIWKL